MQHELHDSEFGHTPSHALKQLKNFRQAIRSFYYYVLKIWNDHDALELFHAVARHAVPEKQKQKFLD
jgi:hypothetical protein